MKPKFSIIVPVYNAEKYLKRCLDSIKNQTYKNFECIIVNDGSTDNSISIIKNYLDDKRFLLVEQKNSGVSDARNNGVNKASGEYLLFIDSDDAFENNAFEIINENLEDEDILRYQYQEIGKYVNRINELPFIDNKADLIFNYKTVDVVWLYSVNKKYYDDNNFKFISGRFHEDFDLVIRMLYKAKKVKSISDILYNYYLTDNSIMRTKDKAKTLKKYEDVKAITLNLLKDIDSPLYRGFIINSYFNKMNVLEEDKFNKELNFINEKKMLKYLPETKFKQRIKKLLLKINFKLFYKLFY